MCAILTWYADQLNCYCDFFFYYYQWLRKPQGILSRLFYKYKTFFTVSHFGLFASKGKENGVYWSKFLTHKTCAQAVVPSILYITVLVNNLLWYIFAELTYFICYWDYVDITSTVLLNYKGVTYLYITWTGLFPVSKQINYAIKLKLSLYLNNLYGPPYVHTLNEIKYMLKVFIYKFQLWVCKRT